MVVLDRGMVRLLVETCCVSQVMGPTNASHQLNQVAAARQYSL